MKARNLIYVASLAASIALTGCDDGNGSAEASTIDPRVQQGLAIAPVKLNLAGKDANAVALGSYLVNAVGGCNDCHTQPPYSPGGDPHQGQTESVNAANYLAGGQAFGPFCSKNLTPDSSGLPAGLSSDAFIKEMRSGVDPGTGKLLQVMPWPAYAKMTDDDLKAIYAYLGAIPAAQPQPPGTTVCAPG